MSADARKNLAAAELGGSSSLQKPARLHPKSATVRTGRRTTASGREPASIPLASRNPASASLGIRLNSPQLPAPARQILTKIN